MAAERTMYGPWAVTVLLRAAAYDQRFVITGSTGQDGAYPATVGAATVAVDGDEWTLRCEWSDGSSGWKPSDLRVDAEYTLEEGYIVYLGVDDNEGDQRDFDYDDVILKLVSLDPEDCPWGVVPPRFEFVADPDVVGKSLAEHREAQQQRYEDAQRARWEVELHPSGPPLSAGKG